MPPNQQRDEDDFQFGLPSEDGDEDDSSIHIFANTIAQLQDELQKVKDDRNEERLYWLFAGFLPVNVIIYIALENWIPFILLFIFQLFVMLGLARKFGHEWAEQTIGSVLNFIVHHLPSMRGKD